MEEGKKNSNLKRFMASLLAVVMLFSVVGISPAVFAEDAVAPELKANSGEVIIKSGMTNDEVAQTLNKALISNYDELDDATKAALQWEYKGYGYTKNGVPSAKKHWGTINGNVSFTEKHGFTYFKYVSEALKDADNGDYQVRLAGTTTEATLVWVDKYTSEVVLKAGTTCASSPRKAQLSTTLPQALSTTGSPVSASSTQRAPCPPLPVSTSLPLPSAAATSSQCPRPSPSP